MSKTGSETAEDEALVLGILADPELFSELVYRYEDRLGRYLARLGVINAADREDLLQDIFVKI